MFDDESIGYSISADSHGACIDISDIRWGEVLVDVHGSVQSDLPEAEDAEEHTNVHPDEHEDVANEPVEKVWNPVSRLCHVILFFLIFIKTKSYHRY